MKGRFWSFVGNQFFKKSDAMYAHLCEHIMKFWSNNRIHSHNSEIETSENNFIAENTLNKRLFHIFVSSSKNL